MVRGMKLPNRWIKRPNATHAPKRGRCPECGKLGLGPSTATAYMTRVRHCRYCQHVVVIPVGKES